MPLRGQLFEGVVRFDEPFLEARLVGRLHHDDELIPADPVYILQARLYYL